MVVEFVDLLDPFVRVAVVAEGGAIWCSLLLHGDFSKLHRAEFKNGGDLGLSLSLAGVAAPCCGAAGATEYSTSRPASQLGGPSAALLQRPASRHLQVVPSPAMVPTAAVLS
jgi:hypothetical protein